MKRKFLSKYPFEINLIELVSATIIFKISDVGFILSRGKKAMPLLPSILMRQRAQQMNTEMQLGKIAHK